jgi:hypothetical protein
VYRTVGDSVVGPLVVDARRGIDLYCRPGFRQPQTEVQNWLFGAGYDSLSVRGMPTSGCVDAVAADAEFNGRAASAWMVWQMSGLFGQYVPSTGEGSYGSHFEHADQVRAAL